MANGVDPATTGLYLLLGLRSSQTNWIIVRLISHDSTEIDRKKAMQLGGGEEEDEVVGAGDEQPEMEIGWPTEVRHVAHVTFDRFHGFRGVPEELLLQEEGMINKAPSASKTVFGVSTESMQCSSDARGNSVPTILLRMQRRLYDSGGLAAEGIFRIAADGTHEQHVRDQLNAGVVPDNVDVHCLAGLIKVNVFSFLFFPPPL